MNQLLIIKLSAIIPSLALGSMVAFFSPTLAFAAGINNSEDICGATYAEIIGEEIKFLVSSKFNEAVVCTGFSGSTDETRGWLTENPRVTLIGTIGFEEEFGLPDFNNPREVGLFDEVLMSISPPWEFEGIFAENPQSITIPWYQSSATESPALTTVTLGPGLYGIIDIPDYDMELLNSRRFFPVDIQIAGIDNVVFEGDVANSPTPVPEPTTILSSMTVLGLGMFWKKTKTSRNNS